MNGLGQKQVLDADGMWPTEPSASTGSTSEGIVDWPRPGSTLNFRGRRYADVYRGT